MMPGWTSPFATSRRNPAVRSKTAVRRLFLEDNTIGLGVPPVWRNGGWNLRALIVPQENRDTGETPMIP